MSTQLQYAFQIKLAEFKCHALINYQVHKIVNFILENFQFIIIRYC